MRVALPFGVVAGTVAGILGAVTLGLVQPALARYEGPWCAHRLLGGGFVENQCSMRSYEMCREYIFATAGAWCTQNPYYVGPPEPPPRKAKRRPQ